MQPYSLVILTLTSLWISSLQALEIDTDFSGGSVGTTEIDAQSNKITFTARNPPTPQNLKPAYWYFRIKDLKPNTPLNLQTAALGKQPKAFIATSEDRGATWKLQEALQANGGLTCTITPKTETLLVASTPPLSSTKLLAELTEISQHRNGVEWIAPENAGGEFPVLRISEGDRVDARRYGVWIQSIPDVFTHNSNWALLGLVKWLFSADTAAVWLRQNAEVYICVSESYTPPKLLKDLEAESRFRISLHLHNETSEDQPATLWIFPQLEGTDELEKSLDALMPVKVHSTTFPCQSIESVSKTKMTLDIKSWSADSTPENAQHIGEILAAFISKDLEASPPP